MVAACPHTGESVPWARVRRPLAQSPTAQPHQEGVTETSVSAGMGSERPAGQRAGSNWGRVATHPRHSVEIGDPDREGAGANRTVTSG